MLVLALSACASRAQATSSPAPEPAAATAALGVPMPPGTVMVSELGGAGPEGARQSRAALATRSSEADALAFFRALPRAQPAPRSCVTVSGAMVCVTPPEEIPRTLFAPVTPVADVAPSWALAWVVVTRAGAPPPCPACVEGSAPPPGCSCP